MFLIRSAESIPRALLPGYFRARQHLAPVAAAKTVSPVEGGADKAPEGERPSIALQRYQSQEQGEAHRILYAHHIMTSPVFTMSVDSNLQQAITTFTERRYRHIPIVDSRDQLVGLISDRDVLRFRAEHAGGTAKERLENIMVKEVLIATPDTPVRDVARTMFEERIGSLPIVDYEGKMEGIITRSDIIRALIAHGPMNVWA
jgi:acetoin utilization protein AcuB